MKTIAFFNHKSGVGKTTLVYHLAHMLARLGHSTLAVDLDPQADLTATFFDESQLENLWAYEPGSNPTILTCLKSILDGTASSADPVEINLSDTLAVVAGDLGLSRFEERLSAAWPRGCRNDPAALRTTSAFHGIVQAAGANTKASIALIDLGPNLGAINGAAVLASDYIVVPLVPDLFSIQSLRNIGPTIRSWRSDWKSVRGSAPTDFPLPDGIMQPAGYVVLQQAVRLDRPVHGYSRWLQGISEVYRNDVLDDAEGNLLDQNHCLATLRNYWSLMPMAEEARKPMFDLTPADGALGSHAHLVRTCKGEFRALAARLLKVCSIPSSS